MRAHRRLGQEMKCFGFAGWSGAGKTTLIEQLVRVFVARGLRVSLIKHTHHEFDLDREGKDSYRFREAGAAEIILAGAQRWALMHEHREPASASFADIVARLDPCDLVLVEGFKAAELPKIEVFRPALAKPRLHPDWPNVVALASDVAITTDIPLLPLNEPERIAHFVLNFTRLI